MSHRSRPRFMVVVVLLLLFLIFSLAVASVYADPGKPDNPGKAHITNWFWWHWFKPRTVEDVEFLGMTTFPTGPPGEEFMIEDTVVGGLSAITYDARRGVYYVLSDDKSEVNPARYYTVHIDVFDESLDDGDVTFVDVTFLKDHKGKLYEEGTIDPEGINMLTPGQLFISSEGDEFTGPPIDPAVGRYNRSGKLNRALPVPDKFLYSVDDGNNVRDNLAFESLTSTPNRRYLVTASEQALENDGPMTTVVSDTMGTSPSRVLLFDARKKQPRQEYVYCVGPIPVGEGAGDNGLVELVALDNHGTLLAMERSFVPGFGNTVKLFETSTRGAKDVSGITALNWDGCKPSENGVMARDFVADFAADFGVQPDNLEGMTLGPKLSDGRYLLIVVSDNNFNWPWQPTTQFIALAVELGYAD